VYQILPRGLNDLMDDFWHDWKKFLGLNHVIQKFELYDFTPIYEWHLGEKEKKQMSIEVSYYN